MSNINSESLHLSPAVKRHLSGTKMLLCMSNKRKPFKEINYLCCLKLFQLIWMSTWQMFSEVSFQPDSNAKVFPDTVGINLNYFPIYISFLSHGCLLSQSRGHSRVSQFQSLVFLLQNPSTMTLCHSSCKSQIDFL